jgi:hypothetical protein
MHPSNSMRLNGRVWNILVLEQDNRQVWASCPDTGDSHIGFPATVALKAVAVPPKFWRRW